MIAYENAQTGYLVIGLLIVGLLMALSTLSLEYIGLHQYLVIVALIIALVLFYKLTVRVDRGIITCSFGQGVISKRILVKELTGCRVVRTHWYEGIGIRLTTRGWMYNIGGNQAVELTYKSGKKFIIGSNEAETLCEVIEEEIQRFQ